MKDGVYNIYSFEMGYRVFNFERWQTQHISLRNVLHTMYSWLIGHTAYTHGIWRTLYVLMYSWLIGHTAYTHGIWRTLYVLMRYGVEGIYLWYVESSAFNHERRSRLYFVTRFGVDNIFPFISQNILMIDGVHNIYSICMEYTVSWEMKPTALTSEG